ncbi:RNA ligase family protein [Undibacterium sp. TS12]|uniref:RNA ligase family protein n=1 Tax=Undibacterium sp. TS12 TaxID=2908202 RepID=UPI001F4CDBA3|nr:RNA ligase family protein [Undibacterium sp. TS12]MCH8618213.1 hypothetical protein [Undibacterium sp. TS12]
MILPLSSFPELAAHQNKDSDADLAQLLGIEKWEAPIPASLSGEIEAAFPSFIRKTDQERIQNMPELLTSNVNEEFEVTVKLDGSSMTIFHNDGVCGICTRNWWIKETASNSLWRVAAKNKLLTTLEAYGRNLALQGEIIGEGIQGNPEKLRGQEFYLFDVYDIEQGQYLGQQARAQVIEDLRTLGAELSGVPCLGTMTLALFEQDVAKILDFAEGPSLNPITSREGLVFKRLDGGVSFKVISNSYLLKHGDR